MAELTRCPICGVELFITNKRRKWCPNHGAIEEEKTKSEIYFEENITPNYVG